jgi:hypothetical protein
MPTPQSKSHVPWPLAVQLLVRMLPEEFSLGDVYATAEPLRKAFPDNHHIEAKIRQSLQVLRDRGSITFDGPGRYRKIAEVRRRTVRIDFDEAARYASRSQVARIAIEAWAAKNVACWRCESPLVLVPANAQLLDAVCRSSAHEIQIKAVSGVAPDHLSGAAFGPIARRLASGFLPDYLIVSYDRQRSIVLLAEFIDGTDLAADRLRARSPLGAGARRAGWIGTSIDLAGLSRIVVVGPTHTPEVQRWP